MFLPVSDSVTSHLVISNSSQALHQERQQCFTPSHDMFITCDTVLTSHVQHSTFNIQFSTSSVRDLVDHYVRFTLEPDLIICNTGSVNIPIPVRSLHSSVSEA